ncbi:siderophore-interacting protein [Tsukamurella sp. 8F]|uniref:siderophore-interacting protein n=1 Tax=unclassified Tsukamurella TaxID=2633480 RepID=UPI0023B88771|nr:MULTISPECIES: siderophore-interacting protein [unclassified Tsukamurella]MDF0530943.1 siderophore-interacting protein [Tsukamurella sp. 8J]MDF0588268.1 siderophore-interacting protein [Tsukamurella sp. 8F]
MGRGVQGLILKALRADDYVFTVRDTEKVNEHFHRVRFTGGGFLAAHPWYPTMWVRLWIPKSGEATPGDDDGTLVQRGYTIVDPDGDAFTIEFAMHDGPAPRWAADAQPGDTIGATLMGSKFAFPESPPSEYVLVGDAASLPAMNSLLDHANAPARIFLEYQHDDERTLPVRGDDVTWVARTDRGAGLVAAVEAAKVPADAFVWVAAEARATRESVKAAKRQAVLPKTHVKSQAYWMERG